MGTHDAQRVIHQSFHNVDNYWDYYSFDAFDDRGCLDVLATRLARGRGLPTILLCDTLFSHL